MVRPHSMSKDTLFAKKSTPSNSRGTPRPPSTPQTMPINEYVVEQTANYISQLNDKSKLDDTIQALFNVGLETRKSTPIYLHQLSAEQHKNLLDFELNILTDFVDRASQRQFTEDKALKFALKIVEAGYTLINDFHEAAFASKSPAPGN